MQLIDGKAIAGEVRAQCAQESAALQEKGIVPSLTVILVGEDPASQVYVRNKERACRACGVRSRVIRLPKDAPQHVLMDAIASVNADESVHGLLVQLPLPAHLDEQAAIRAIDPRKDVDGFHPVNAGLLLEGQDAPLTPCTPTGCIELLRRANVPMDGARAVVLGRSNIVGKPMALMLLRENCTVTVCHSHTKNLAEITREADILVLAIGKARFVTADMVKPGAAVIDVGINRLPDGTLCGDADESVAEVAGYLTPVPGGVGPMTVACLMKNTIEAAKRYGR